MQPFPLPPAAIAADEVRHALRRVVHSASFVKAHRGTQLLIFLVQAALLDPPVQPKEFTIAAEVFAWGATYDPAVHATVRVEACRLRTRLRDYYAGQGRCEAIEIEIPKGGYGAVFHRRNVRSLQPSALTGDDGAGAWQKGAVPGVEEARVLIRDLLGQQPESQREELLACLFWALLREASPQQLGFGAASPSDRLKGIDLAYLQQIAALETRPAMTSSYPVERQNMQCD